MAEIKVGYSKRFIERCLRMFEEYSDEEMIKKKQQLIDGFQNGRVDTLHFVRTLDKFNACLVGRGVKV